MLDIEDLESTESQEAFSLWIQQLASLSRYVEIPTRGQ